MLRPSTLGCEIATPTELPGVRTVHGVYCLFATTALAYTYESITSFYNGNIIIAKQISHNWLVHSLLEESQRGAFQDVLLKQQQLLQSFRDAYCPRPSPRGRSTMSMNSRKNGHLSCLDEYALIIAALYFSASCLSTPAYCVPSHRWVIEKRMGAILFGAHSCMLGTSIV